MPIRMVDDEPRNNSSQNERSNSSKSSNRFAGLSSGAGGVIANILSVALPYLIKKPKLLLVVGAVALIYYFFFR